MGNVNLHAEDTETASKSGADGETGTLSGGYTHGGDERV